MYDRTLPMFHRQYWKPDKITIETFAITFRNAAETDLQYKYLKQGMLFHGLKGRKRLESLLGSNFLQRWRKSDRISRMTALGMRYAGQKVFNPQEGAIDALVIARLHDSYEQPFRDVESVKAELYEAAKRGQEETEDAVMRLYIGSSKVHERMKQIYQYWELCEQIIKLYRADMKAKDIHDQVDSLRSEKQGLIEKSRDDKRHLEGVSSLSRKIYDTEAELNGVHNSNLFLPLPKEVQGAIDTLALVVSDPSFILDLASNENPHIASRDFNIYKLQKIRW